MKKILIFLLAAVALTCLFSCTDGGNTSQTQSTSSNGIIELPEDEF